MSKTRSGLKSNKQTNRDQGAGPMKEGLVSVATNFMFSASGLRTHNPKNKPLFNKSKEYCLQGRIQTGAPAGTSC